MPTVRGFIGAACSALLLMYMYSHPALAVSKPKNRSDCSHLKSFLQDNYEHVYTKQKTKNCCLWYNLTVCSKNTSRISELHLAGLGLKGVLPTGRIGFLNHLTRIDLSNNSLSGAIPSDIWKLPSLQTLNLARNGFNGNEPFNGSKLSNLNASNNQLDRKFLEGVVTRLQSLTNLDLRNNSISGGIPTLIGSLSELQHLNLSLNHLNGSISILQNLTDLHTLDLSFNKFNGSFPPGLAKLPHLESLNVSNNELTGDVDATAVAKFRSSAFGNNRFAKKLSPTPQPSPPLTISAPSTVIPLISHLTSKRPRSTVVIVAASIGGVAFVTLAIFVTVFLCRRRRRMKWVLKKPPRPFNAEKYVPDTGPFSFEADSGMWVADVKDPSSVPVVIFEKPLLNLTFADLLQATASFSRESEVGDGTGLMYKCLLPGVLPGDSEVAIKVLVEARSWKDNDAVERFEAMGKIKHENLLAPLGYCIVGEERLLIYKFMRNGYLHDRLHALPIGNLEAEDYSLDTWEQNELEESSNQMAWALRHKIALGTARALAFIHHGCAQQLVHRDISSSNILLDENFEPHLAGCCLASMISPEDTFTGGADGYVPPEYNGCSKVTTRGDAYSFGVVLLELVTGKRPVGDYYPDYNCNNLVAWVRHLMKEQRGSRALDPKLINGGATTENLVEALRIGYLCTAESPAKRPTMQQVVGLLKDLIQQRTDLPVAAA